MRVSCSACAERVALSSTDTHSSSSLNREQQQRQHPITLVSTAFCLVSLAAGVNALDRSSAQRTGGGQRGATQGATREEEQHNAISGPNDASTAQPTEPRFSRPDSVCRTKQRGRIVRLMLRAQTFFKDIRTVYMLRSAYWSYSLCARAKAIRMAAAVRKHAFARVPSLCFVRYACIPHPPTPSTFASGAPRRPDPPLRTQSLGVRHCGKSGEHRARCRAGRHSDASATQRGRDPNRSRRVMRPQTRGGCEAIVQSADATLCRSHAGCHPCAGLAAMAVWRDGMNRRTGCLCDRLADDVLTSSGCPLRGAQIRSPLPHTHAHAQMSDHPMKPAASSSSPSATVPAGANRTFAPLSPPLTPAAIHAAHPKRAREEEEALAQKKAKAAAAAAASSSASSSSSAAGASHTSSSSPTPRPYRKFFIDGCSLTPEELVAIGYGSCPGVQAGSITQGAALAGAEEMPTVFFDSEYIVEVSGEAGATNVVGSQSIYDAGSGSGSGVGKRGPAHHVLVDLTPDAWEAVARGRAVIDDVLSRSEIAYGINTGFGNFANVIIAPDELEQLQANLIRSHASGVGMPLSPAKTRMLLALRINVLAKGHSGIRVETVERMLAALNANCLPLVPSKGTVGASGDLAPLSHLALGLMGEGKMWNPRTHTYGDASEVLKAHQLVPITLQAKEGLALINGTQLITSIGAEAVSRARSVARTADVVAAMTLEALKASARPFHPVIHAVRPHKGQELVAGRLRCLLDFGGKASEITISHKGCGKVQDAYTMRSDAARKPARRGRREGGWETMRSALWIPAHACD